MSLYKFLAPTFLFLTIFLLALNILRVHFVGESSFLYSSNFINIISNIRIDFSKTLGSIADLADRFSFLNVDILKPWESAWEAIKGVFTILFDFFGFCINVIVVPVSMVVDLVDFLYSIFSSISLIFGFNPF